jgi:hypothetical protein
MKLLRRFFRWLLNKNELEALGTYLQESNILLAEIYGDLRGLHAIVSGLNKELHQTDLIEKIRPIGPILNKTKNQWS